MEYVMERKTSQRINFEQNPKVDETEQDEGTISSPPIRPKSAVESFKYAVDGILDVFRTQKHMRFHFVTMVLVLLAATMLNMSKQDILIILFVISLVLIAEMFNSAIEAVCDMVTQTYHPLAKFAKDAAAGAVLIAAVTAVLVGIMLSIGESSIIGQFEGFRPRDTDYLTRVIVAGVIVIVLTTIVKLLGSKGKLLRGGLASAHTAIGFFLALSILYISENGIAAIMGILMALLIAQSRVQAKIHTVQEVITGALLALLITATVYWFPSLWNLLFQHTILHFGGVFNLGR
jgi:diacylglycerol kinase (ATP)